MLGVLLDAHWRILVRLLGRPELENHADYATTRERVLRRAELNTLVSDWVGPLTVADVVARLEAVGLPASPVRTYAEAARDPHVLERDMLQPMVLENGAEAPVVGPAAKLSRTPVRVRTAAPALGAHTDEILSELGLDDAERARLRDAGVV